MALLIGILRYVESTFCGVQGNSVMPQRAKREVHYIGRKNDGVLQQRRQV
jgi:hypothetical protein